MVQIKYLYVLYGINSSTTSVKNLDDLISIPFEQIIILCFLLCKFDCEITSLIF